ncbi:MAG: DUF4407 domain-containing protein [Myxococcales bacterium]|nr:DUF4407 domain-containing protein [Myxococcales bacterium]
MALSSIKSLEPISGSVRDSMTGREPDLGRTFEGYHSTDAAQYADNSDETPLPAPALGVTASDRGSLTTRKPSSLTGTSPADEPVPRTPHTRAQTAPFMDLYAPTWLTPLIRLLVLDEHGPMPRTVQAQAGFGILLMTVQFCMDMLAWTLGFRWVFVNAMGWPGWILAVLFAFLISLVIIIFERFVLTADVYASKVPLFLNPAILMRVIVVVLFAAITSIPVEMMVFHDVIQGRLNGELQGVREAARHQLRGDIHKDIEDVATEEGKSRTRLKEETPPVRRENLEVPAYDGRVNELSTKYNAVMAELTQEEMGWRSGRKGKGPKWHRLNDEKAGLEREIGDAKAARQTEVDRRVDANHKTEEASAKRHFEELAKISDRYDPRKRELEKKLRDVDRMPDAELKQATKREFAVVDGFARRWKIMNELEKEDALFNMTKWAVRGLFIAFGLLVLTTKALFNRPTRAYYAGLDPLRVNESGPRRGSANGQ